MIGDTAATGPPDARSRLRRGDPPSPKYRIAGAKVVGHGTSDIQVLVNKNGTLQQDMQNRLLVSALRPVSVYGGRPDGYPEHHERPAVRLWPRLLDR